MGNVTSKTQKTSIFHSCRVDLEHTDCFRPVASELMRRFDPGSSRRRGGGDVPMSGSNTEGLATCSKTCLTYSTLTSDFVYVCVCVTCLVTSTSVTKCQLFCSRQAKVTAGDLVACLNRVLTRSRPRLRGGGFCVIHLRRPLLLSPSASCHLNTLVCSWRPSSATAVAPHLWVTDADV